MVTVNGLERCSHLNLKIGRVVDFDYITSRWILDIEGQSLRIAQNKVTRIGSRKTFDDIYQLRRKQPSPNLAAQSAPTVAQTIRSADTISTQSCSSEQACSVAESVPTAAQTIPRFTSVARSKRPQSSAIVTQTIPTQSSATVAQTIFSQSGATVTQTIQNACKRQRVSETPSAGAEVPQPFADSTTSSIYPP